MSDPVQNTPAPSPETSEGGSDALNISTSPSNKAPDPSTPKTDATTQQKIAKLKKLRLKVDGEEFDEELPFEIDDNPEVRKYLERNLQMSRVAQKRMNEYSTLEREVGEFVNMLKDNPRAALGQLANLGVDARQMAARIIEEEIEQSKKSPEQIEKEKLEARLRELEDERAAEKKTAKEKELAALEEKAFDEYNKGIDSALEKSSMPKSGYVKSRVADYLILALQNGIKIAPEQVVPMVEADIKKELQDMFSVAPEDVIEALVGKENISRVRRKYMKRATSPAQAAKVVDTGKSTPSAEAPAAKKTIKELFGV